MGLYRRFAKTESLLADAWSSVVESGDTWTLGARIAGESGSYLAVNQDGVRAVAKPSVAHNDGIPRAAHEKIASDLAHHVGVPVPAAVLWRDGKTQKTYSVSAWAFNQCLTWKGLVGLGLITPEFIEGARPIISVGTVFHTWIDNKDIHGENVLVDADAVATSPGIAFIDNSFAMSRTWRSENEPLLKAGTDYCGPVSLLPGPMAEVTAKIHSLDTKLIEEIVSRIPDIYLPSTRRKLILANLMRRREELAGVFGVL